MTARRSARPGEGGAISPSVPARPRGGWLEHALADAVQDGLLVLDAALRIARVNGAFCALTGFAEHELLGAAPPYPFWPEGERPRALARKDEVETLDGGHFEVLVRRRDGSLVEAVMSAAPARDRAGAVIAYVATYKDVSDARREARRDAALRRLAARVAAGIDPDAAVALAVDEARALLPGAEVEVRRRVGEEGAGPPGPAQRVASAPIDVDGARWGELVARAGPDGALGAAADDLVASLAGLLAVAVATAATRARLEEQAAILSSLREGLVVLDAEGRIVQVNDALAGLTGFAARELIGHLPPYPFAERGAPDLVPRAAAGPVERVLRRKDGALRHVAVAVGPLPADTEGVARRSVVLTDITDAVVQARVERATAEIAAAVARGDLDDRGVFDRVAAVVFELLEAGAASVVRFDVDALRVVGTHGSAGVPFQIPRDAPSAAARVARSGRTERIDDWAPLGGELARIAAAGGLRTSLAVPIRIHGALWGCVGAASARAGGFPAGIEGLLERVADLVAVALANAEANGRLRRQSVILDSLQDGLVVVDPAGAIVQVNGPFCRMVDRAADELLGTAPPYPFAPGTDADPLAPAAGDGPTVERTLVRRDGRPLHVAATVGSIRDADGVETGRAAVVTDISEAVFQARLERALAEVASASAAGASASGLFDLLSARVAELLDAPAAAVVRFDGAVGHLVGRFGAVALPAAQSLAEPGVASAVARTGRSARIDDYRATPGGAFVTAMLGAGLRSAVGVPVTVHGRLWGSVNVVGDRPGGLPPDTERLLERFASVVALAVASADTLATLQHQADTDGLTGLLNRRAFGERLDEELRRAARHGRPVALVLFDLDGFKAANDAHGHLVGDRVLRAVASAFLGEARAGDVAARVGGDEFALIAPDTDARAAGALAERLRAATRAAIAPLDVPVTLSAGVTDVRGTASARDLLHRADVALYRAKHGGRDCTVIDAGP